MQVSQSLCRLTPASNFSHRRTIVCQQAVARVPTRCSPVDPVQKCPVERQVVCAASSSSAPRPSSADDSHAGYAVLHDFCMTLPYGALTLMAALVCFFLGPVTKPLAVPLAAVGAGTLLSAVLSLKVWKQAQSSTLYTLASAAAAGAAAYMCYPLVANGTVGLFAGGLTLMSAAACLFCLYNVVAGGNPPRKGSK